MVAEADVTDDPVALFPIKLDTAVATTGRLIVDVPLNCDKSVGSVKPPEGEDTEPGNLSFQTCESMFCGPGSECEFENVWVGSRFVWFGSSSFIAPFALTVALDDRLARLIVIVLSNS
jgi:hypothetical protein